MNVGRATAKIDVVPASETLNGPTACEMLFAPGTVAAVEKIEKSPAPVVVVGSAPVAWLTPCDSCVIDVVAPGM